MHGSSRHLIGVITALVVLVSAGVVFGGAPVEDTSVPIADDIGGMDEDFQSFDRLPWELKFDYTLMSDYVWRGINWTDYPGEHTERPSNQVGVGVELDTAAAIGGNGIGTLGARMWFQWWGGLAASGGRDDDLQEVDYRLYWNNEIEELATTLEFGWIYYTFPSIPGDANTTSELYIEIKVDDKYLFGADKGVFNPSIYYGVDVDLTHDGSWLDLGVEHTFDLVDYEPFSEMPAMAFTSITPSMRLGVDNRYLDAFTKRARIGHPGTRATRLGRLLCGISVDYDVGKAMNLPEEYGRARMSWFIKYSDALRTDILSDALYGGFRFEFDW
ncbi:MAG: hypothetical protein J7M40_14575 [Planctomycetes bacterium]|nr:hypothetical protein [Planctomycetota bacterium]